MSVEPAVLVAGADEGIRVIGLSLSGRRDDARKALIRMRRAHIPAFQSWSEFKEAGGERLLGRRAASESHIAAGDCDHRKKP